MIAAGLDPFACGSVSVVDRLNQRMALTRPGNKNVYCEELGGNTARSDGPPGYVEGSPVRDLAIHRAIQTAFSGVFVVIHFHSAAATAWSQAGRDLPCLGTTHAAEFGGVVPCTRELAAAEWCGPGGFEAGLGGAIVEAVRSREWDPRIVCAVLARHDGPWVWGSSASVALHKAKMLEFVARLGLDTVAIHPAITPMNAPLSDAAGASSIASMA